MRFLARSCSDLLYQHSVCVCIPAARCFGPKCVHADFSVWTDPGENRLLASDGFSDCRCWCGLFSSVMGKKLPALFPPPLKAAGGRHNRNNFQSWATTKTPPAPIVIKHSRAVGTVSYRNRWLCKIGSVTACDIIGVIRHCEIGWKSIALLL